MTAVATVDDDVGLTEPSRDISVSAIDESRRLPIGGRFPLLKGRFDDANDGLGDGDLSRLTIAPRTLGSADSARAFRFSPVPPRRLSGGGRGGTPGRFARFRGSAAASRAAAPRFLAEWEIDGFRTSWGFGAMKTALFASPGRTRARVSFEAGDWGSGFEDGRCERNAWWEESGRACTVTMARGAGMSATGEEFGGVSSAILFEGVVSPGGGRWVIAP